MGQMLDADDMQFHMLIGGGTGSGKTNSVLYMLNLLFTRNYDGGATRPSLFLFDPAGDASIDLLRAIPKSEWSRVTIFDPQYVTFGFNLLSLPESLDPADKPEVLQAQVEEFSALLSDVFNTDATNAPRLMWIFKGALYYLYSFGPDPTLWELYSIMLLFTKKSPREVEDLLSKKVKESEIVKETMEAIAKLPQDAYSPVLNRISHFVLPPSSMTFRTFCSRKSTIDLEALMEPGRLTIFRIPSTLPGEFRKLFSAAVVMKLYFATLKRARRLESEGLPPTARTPVVLAADEFRDISQMRILRTILSQSRKFGLYLWMVVQTLSEVPEELMGSIQANVGPVLAFRGSPDDARKLAKILSPRESDAVEDLIPGLEDYAALVRKRPVGGRPVEPSFRVTFPKLRDPLHEYGDAIGYMKQEMEKAYGGSVGDRELKYKPELEKAEKESGNCPFDYPMYWVPLTYLHCQNREIGFAEICEFFDEKWSWTANTVQVALSELYDSGWVAEKAGTKRFSVLDEKTGQYAWKEPASNDARMLARETRYSLTTAAKREFFDFNLMAPERAGRPLHVRVMKALLENYWQEGHWCAWDKGNRSGSFPDILVTQTKREQVKGKEGKQNTILGTKDWGKRVPVEVETNPSKHLEQVRINYDKNVARWGKVRFVVASWSQEPEIRRILQDKDSTTLEVVVEGAGLPETELERLLKEEEKAEAERASALNTHNDSEVAKQLANPNNPPTE